jgi:hypothetical protein
MIRQVDTIDVTGVNGDFCRISPPGFSWGPELAPGSTGLFDLPIQTNWGSYGYGQFFQSWKPKRRDVVWTVHVMDPNRETFIGPDSDVWHTVYSRWRAMFAPDKEATITYTSVDGSRTLGLRTLDTPKPFSSQNFEGGDPHLWAYGSIVQTMAAEFPFYVGKPFKQTFTIEGTGDFWFPIPYFNPSTLEIWPEYDLTGGAKWVLPDYSFGNEIWGRGLADLGRTVPIPELMVGENATVMSRMDQEWILSVWETPVMNRSPGIRHIYPIPAGAGSPDEDGANPGGIVRALNVVDGAECTLTLPRWYAEPFSTPLVA